MSALLDYCVPARRREKRRLQGLQERLDSRWGDLAITAPTEGGWNNVARIESEDHLDAPHEVTPVKTDRKPSANTTTKSNVIPKSRQHVATTLDSKQDNSRQQPVMKLAIPMPWVKKSHHRSSSLTEPTTLGEIKTDVPTVSRSQAASPVVTYKPASEAYRKELEQNLGGVANDSTKSPTIVYKPASEEYKKALDDMVGIKPPSAPASPPHEDKSPISSPGQMFGLEAVQEAQNGDETYDVPSLINSPTSHKSYDEATNPSTAKSSPQYFSDTSTATSPTTTYASGDVRKSMAELGLAPSPPLRQDGFLQPPSTSPSRATSSTFRESLSSSSGSEGDRRSRGLRDSTMASGTYYAKMADEYRQIAKSVEDEAVVEFAKKALKQSRQAPANSQGQVTTTERPLTLSRKTSPTLPSGPRRELSDDDDGLNARIRGQSSGRPATSAGDRPRATSVGRHEGHTRERIRAASRDRHAGNLSDRKRAMSKDRALPQVLVPAAEDLWG